MSHLFLYELPLAVEQNMNATNSRDIAWDLVTDSIFQIQAIIFCFSIFFVIPSFIWQRIADFINSGVTFESIANLLTFSHLSFYSFFSETLMFFGVLFIPVLSPIIDILFNLFVNPFFDWIHPNIVLYLVTSAIWIIFKVTFGALFIPFWQSLKAVTYYQLNLLGKSEADTLGFDRN